MDKKHIVIVGDKHVGKSTLIKKLLDKTDKSVCGFYTKLKPTGGGYRAIHIYDAASDDREPSDANKLADCGHGNMTVYKEIFNTLGVEYLSKAKADSIIVMDELGFMENEAEDFKAKVLELFEGDIPIIAAVKTGHDSDFLIALRNHPNANIYRVDMSNREELADSISLK